MRVESLANLLPNLQKLIMSDCGIDNETMADFRERARDRYKVVWAAGVIGMIELAAAVAVWFIVA